MNILEFVGHMAVLQSEIEEMGHRALETACRVVEDEAKSGMGNYKFNFVPLQPRTIARKLNGDTPLVETGALKASIQHNVFGHSGFVGTDDDKGFFNFLGTSRIPARDPIRSAVGQSGDKVEMKIGRDFAAWIGGEGLPKTRIR